MISKLTNNFYLAKQKNLQINAFSIIKKKIKNFLIILILFFLFGNAVFADSFYFKECAISDFVSANYLIDLDKKLIYVNLKANNGSQQNLIDKIESVGKDQIISEKIQSEEGQNNFFQYFLDAKSNSVTKLKYKREKGIDMEMFRLDGPKKQSYCADVKADWYKMKVDQIKKKEEKIKDVKEEEEKKKKEELKRKAKEAKEEKLEKKNRHRILINAEKWIKLSDYTTDSGKQLKIDFDKRAAALCVLTKKFRILKKKVKVMEMDSTPVWGTETVIKLGIDGIIECEE